MELAAVVGGALLSSSFEKLLDLLVSPQLLQFSSNTKVQSQLHKWKVMLPMIQAVLEDAQDKESTSQSVNLWLSELRDLVYDAEDVLDEFATEALRLKWKVTTKCLPSFRSSTRLNFISGMGSKLKDITCRLDTICSKMRGLNLGDKGVGVGRGGFDNVTRTPTTSLPDTHFFGRDKDKKALLDLLLADDAVTPVSVIPIHGMGGLGKTTLAQQLYNDDNVKLGFHLRAWVCVSDTFDILAMTRTILQSIGGECRDVTNLDQLQVSLESALSNKKFLIVLDDVWNERYEDWTILCKPFSRGAPGSKIIVTARNVEVAQLTGTTQAYRLGELSHEDCLCLFSQHALGANNLEGHPDLKDIGEKIVQKCKGLPLTAKTLGGLLRTKLQRDEWADILESEIWELPEKKSGILPALRLSYHHLPSQLKQCFAYCALFPKDYEFDVDELVLLWMAEGFLSHPTSTKRLEDVGVQCFNALKSRSFFQPSSKYRARFVMHDLIHDVAQAVTGGVCFHLDASVDKRKHVQSLKTRHSSFIRRPREVSTRFEVFEGRKSLRTLLALPVLANGCYISMDVLDRLLSKLGKLRALSVSSYTIMEVPGSVNGLKHLRYLNLSLTRIKLLPDFVCSLLNLQTLLLEYCNELEKLPSSIGNLRNLCHLNIRQTNKLKEMPTGIGNLTELQSLGKFVVGLARKSELNVRELKNLSKLKGELSLEGLQNVDNTQDARDADLKGKEGLKMLVMRWNSNLDDDPISNHQSVAAQVLELLQPHRNLETLVIESYCGLKFPPWLGDSALMGNAVKIVLGNCWKSTSLPCLGRLPMLKHLIIKGMKEIKSLGDEFYGSECDGGGFQSLETLKLQDMQRLEKWCLRGHDVRNRECGCKLPNLLELEIVNCPVLEGECSVSLPSLQKLKLAKCNESALRSMIGMNSLRTLSIKEMPGLSCLQESVGQLLVGLEDLNISNCEHLLSLWQNEPQIEDDMTSLRLRRLEVKGCPELASLLTRSRIKKMAFLEKMIVSDCPKINSEQWEEEELEINDEVKSSGRLKHVELRNCGDQFIECMVNRVMLGGQERALVERLKITSDSLQHLAIKSKRGGNKVRCMEVEDCKSLVSISNSIVEIEELKIKNCPSLATEGMKLLVAVKELQLWECRQVESVAEESIMLFDQNRNEKSMVMEVMYICDCPNLKRLPQSLYRLTYLVLHKCDGLESFPENGSFPLPCLVWFEIRECKNLKSGPKNMQNLASLKRLVVQGLKSFAEEGGLPPNLTYLEISGCENVKQQMLEPVTSLEELRIGGESSMKDMLLPATLKTLHIVDMKKLESISSSSSSSSSCLVTLDIRGCPKLRYLPKEGLPHTLEKLFITGCPILRSNCVRGKGKYWPQISLIPETHVS